MYLSLAGFVFLCGLANCYFFPRYVHKRYFAGHYAIKDWRDKYAAVHGHEPSQEAIDAYRARLKAQVEEYIATHPNLTEQKKTHGRNLNVYSGMTKNEVRFFLNAPVKVLRDPEDMAKHSGQFWPELQGRVDEAWSYPPYTYFFRGDTLVDIIALVPAVQPL
jgi:hypothetical protein